MFKKASFLILICLMPLTCYAKAIETSGVINLQEVKGGRYIVSVRDPKDVMVSMYRFSEGWWFEPGTNLCSRGRAGPGFATACFATHERCRDNPADRAAGSGSGLCGRIDTQV